MDEDGGRPLADEEMTGMVVWWIVRHHLVLGVRISIYEIWVLLYQFGTLVNDVWINYTSSILDRFPCDGDSPLRVWNLST